MSAEILRNLRQTEGAPRVIREALRLYGTVEAVGLANNAQILSWAAECGMHHYTQDSTPWCGLFAAVVARRSGYRLPSVPERARSWATWGNEADVPSLGDVLVFQRKGGGHVGFYVGEDLTAYHVLGGNQSDKVCITRIAKDRLVAARRSPWKIAQPESVRPVFVTASGALSSNEA